MFIFKKATVYLVAASMMLSGCVTTGTGGSSSSLKVGPKLSSFFGLRKDHSQESDRPRLDVVIPVFDPGLPKDPNDYKKDGVWPELRRAEANRFAVKLKEALEATGKFGAVRVTPDATATGDLYVQGKIDKSNGKEVKIDLVVTDISGEVWMNDSFDHEVGKAYHENIRNKGKDPYDPVFKDAADGIVKEMSGHETVDLKTLQNITKLRFGASFSQNSFAKNMKVHDGKVQLISMPSENDPMLRRTESIRVRDQLFVDRLQTHYASFSQSMNDSYSMWQKQSQLEIEAERKAKRKATGQAIAGIALIGLAVLAAVAGANANNYGTPPVAAAGAAVAGAGGVTMLGKSFQTSEEAKIHRDAINELGQSVNMEMGPQVVKFEDQTVKLTGNAKEQFAQWRHFLKRVYALEKTPNTHL